MTRPVDGQLSTDQAKALAPNVRLVEACPGAGKTRAIVERFRQRTQTSDRGVALISFTNAAIDEVSMRCAADPDALRPPHFVGTFDAFLHRYVVTPFESARLGSVPSYLQSWDELPQRARSVQVGVMAYQTVKLSNFSHDESGEIQFLESNLSGDDKRYFDKASANQRVDLIARGQRRVTAHNDKGLFDSDSARYRALEILQSEEGAALRQLLADRFSDVIVDEFQDCAAVEHQVLEILSRSGIHVTLVADPDQAVFGFRHDQSGLYESFRDGISAADIVNFESNYRSTPAICALVQSLRAHGKATIQSKRTPSSDGEPERVYLLGGDNARIRERFIEISAEWHIPGGERVALAHRATDARSLAAGERDVPKSDAGSNVLLRQISLIVGSGSPALRKKACEGVERLLLRMVNWESEEANLGASAKLEVVGRDSAWVRAIIGDLVAESTGWVDAAAAGAGIRVVLKRELEGLSRPLDGSLGAKFKKPDDPYWIHFVATRDSQRSTGEISWSTIHASKGHEYDAVLLKCPGEPVMADWLAGQSSEERRVFYVGASRARRLLVIAAPKTRLAKLKQQFADKNIDVFSERL